MHGSRPQSQETRLPIFRMPQSQAGTTRCVGFVLILVRVSAACAMGLPLFLR